MSDVNTQGVVLVWQMDAFTLTICPCFSLMYPIASGSTTGKPKNKEVPLLPGQGTEEEGGIWDQIYSLGPSQVGMKTERDFP